MPIPINYKTQFRNGSAEEREIECEELTGNGCSAVDKFNTTKYHSKVCDGLPDKEKGTGPTGVSERNITF